MSAVVCEATTAPHSATPGCESPTPVVEYVVVNQWGEWCSVTFATRAEAEVDLLVCQGIRPDLAFEVVPAVDIAEPVDGPCKWFALCPNMASTTQSHPILGDVPICASCAAWYASLS